MKPEHISPQENNKFKKKYSFLKRTVKQFVYENAALCDQVFQLQEKIIGIKEERDFLFKRTLSFDSTTKPGAESGEHPAVKAQPSGNPQKPMAVKKRDGTWEKAKARKGQAPGGKRKTIVPVPVDSSGLPVFPVHLGPLSVHSLGEIIADRPSFHDQDVLYPVGFCSTRLYGALSDPTTPCMYTCTILDGGAGPIFEIASDLEHEPSISGEDLDAVHGELLRRINDAVGAQVVATRGRGADFFGISHPTVLNLLQCSPGTKKCLNYSMTKFEINKTGEGYTEENDASLTLESLQRSIAFTRSHMEDMHQQETLDSTTTLRDLLNA